MVKDRGILRGTVPWIWTAIVLLATAALAANAEIDVDDLPLVAMPVVFTALGAIIATRSPGNRVAWLFFVVGGGSLIEPIADLRLATAPTDPSIIDVLAIAAVDSSFFVFFLIPIPLLLFVFPTGRFLTRRWSWAGWLAGLMAADILFLTLFADSVGPDNADWTIDNPIGFHHLTFADERGVLILLFGVGLFVLLVGGVVAIAVRYRRSDTITRLQIKWFAYATTFWVAANIYRLISDDRGLVSGLVTGIATLLIPVTIVVAITRYRLFEIDRLISRTVGYAIVVGALAITFVALTALPGLLIGGAGDDGTTESPPLIVAASTLAVAALFNPLRKRVIGWVDRKFNRSRYDAERVVAGFGDRLQDEVDLDRVTNDSIDVVVETMQPQTIGIWVRE